ncbi:uncharacterized protein LOC110863107 [Folsomia candida]|uniref:Uncharacterized protein n=1 Tax=Folsomia candida TaxID=158441 RepID=A0A226F157_FOLCA|nr:uncharacterized protein LOC110863107 [Folsomia candida]XP_035702558.1 uncharacterized protein LOC110863107 [Folsomia candida]OXA63164.1 hypothetical protein Fcan01_01340 [Folsomia candida]
MSEKGRKIEGKASEKPLPTKKRRYSTSAQQQPPNKSHVLVQYRGRSLEFVVPEALRSEDPQGLTFQVTVLHGDGDDPVQLDLVEREEMWSGRPEGVTMSIFEAFKAHLRWGEQPGETDMLMDSSPQFLAMMTEIGDNPSKPVCSLKRSDGTVTRIHHNGQDVMVRWFKGTNVYFKVKVEGQKFMWGSKTGEGGAHKICTVKSCWSISKDRIFGYCRPHSEKTEEVMLLRDVKNYTNPNIVVFCPTLKMTTYTEEDINEYVRNACTRASYHTLDKYMTDRVKVTKDEYPDTWENIVPFWFEIDQSLQMKTTQATRRYNVISVGTSLLVHFHNLACPALADQVFLQMKAIHFLGADSQFWDEVFQFVDKNGLKFFTSPLPPDYDFRQTQYFPPEDKIVKTLPYSYQGHDEGGGIYDGATSTTISMAGFGSNTHRTHKKTALTGLEHTIVPLFQEILDDTAEMDKTALQAEYLGSLSTIIASMLKLKKDGHHIRPIIEQIDQHFNSVKYPELLDMVFAMRTGLKLNVNVEPLLIVDGKPEIIF